MAAGIVDEAGGKRDLVGCQAGVVGGIRHGWHGSVGSAGEDRSFVRAAHRCVGRHWALGVWWVFSMAAFPGKGALYGWIGVIR
jgi:hypothetical protein